MVEIAIEMLSYKNGIYQFKLRAPLYMLVKLSGEMEFLKEEYDIHQFFIPQTTHDLQMNVVTIQHIINHSHQSLELHEEIKSDAVLTQNIMMTVIWFVEKEDLLVMMRRNTIPEIVNKIRGRIF